MSRDDWKQWNRGKTPGARRYKQTFELDETTPEEEQAIKQGLQEWKDRGSPKPQRRRWKPPMQPIEWPD